MSDITLLDLAERVEAATSADAVALSKLNSSILLAVGWTSDGSTAYDPQGNRAMAIPNLVGSVDAAMLLIPEGYRIYSADFSIERRFSWTLKGPLGPWFDPEEDVEYIVPSYATGVATTPALALTAGSLRARHALALSKGSDV